MLHLPMLSLGLYSVSPEDTCDILRVEPQSRRENCPDRTCQGEGIRALRAPHAPSPPATPPRPPRLPHLSRLPGSDHDEFAVFQAHKDVTGFLSDGHAEDGQLEDQSGHCRLQAERHTGAQGHLQAAQLSEIEYNSRGILLASVTCTGP